MSQARTHVRQQRAVVTEQAILEAAAEVFMESGYHKATISRISERAGVTNGALYHHYTSKLDLARAVMLAQRDAFIGLPPGPDGLQRLIDTTLLIAYELKHNKLLSAGVRLAVEQQEVGLHDATPYKLWVEVFRDQLSAAATRDELWEEVDVDNLAWHLVANYTGTQLFSQVEDRHRHLPQQIAGLWHYLLPGIAPPHIRAKMNMEPERFAHMTV